MLRTRTGGVFWHASSAIDANVAPPYSRQGLSPAEREALFLGPCSRKRPPRTRGSGRLALRSRGIVRGPFACRWFDSAPDHDLDDLCYLMTARMCCVTSRPRVLSAAGASDCVSGSTLNTEE